MLLHLEQQATADCVIFAGEHTHCPGHICAHAVDLPLDRGEYDDLVDYLRSTSGFKDEWGETRVETDPQFRK